MQPYTKIEISVGAFVILGVLSLSYLAFTLGGVQFKHRHYLLNARFTSVGQLKVGDPVKIAGVNIGEVRRIKLVDFGAEARLALDDGVKLPDDTIASIQSAGLLGDEYVSLSPGSSDHGLTSGARVLHTEPAISLTELLAKYAFGSPLDSDDGKRERGKNPAQRQKPKDDADELK